MGGGRKGERVNVEVKSFLLMIFCKTIATSSFIKPIENDKVLVFRLEAPAPYFYFDNLKHM